MAPRGRNSEESGFYYGREISCELISFMCGFLFKKYLFIKLSVNSLLRNIVVEYGNACVTEDSMYMFLFKKKDNSKYQDIYTEACLH